MDSLSPHQRATVATDMFARSGYKDSEVIGVSNWDTSSHVNNFLYLFCARRCSAASGNEAFTMNPTIREFRLSGNDAAQAAQGRFCCCC